jgi:hypothetical protein
VSRRQFNLSALFTWRSAISTPESGLSATEHHVLLTLSLHMNELGSSCYPGVERLVEETCGRSSSTIRTALERADKLGWIVREIRRGRNRTNNYEALIPAWYESHRVSYENRRSAAVIEDSIEDRRAAALEAARIALGLPDDAFKDRVRLTKNRRGAAVSPEGVTAGARQKNHRQAEQKPPRSGGKDVSEGASEGATQQQVHREEELPGEPAAAEPVVVEREVIEVVGSMRGADSESPKRIATLAYGLPRSLFLDAVEIVRRRKPENPCGLLTHLLKLARAERDAQLQEAFMASVASKIAVTPVPWSAESLRRDDPVRYVQMLAELVDDDALTAAVGELHPDRMPELLDIARAVRAGDVAAADRETPEQARRRWVGIKAASDLPLDEIHRVVDEWGDADDIERAELHEFADTVRYEISGAATEEAA